MIDHLRTVENNAYLKKCIRIVNNIYFDDNVQNKKLQPLFSLLASIFFSTLHFGENSNSIKITFSIFLSQVLIGIFEYFWQFNNLPSTFYMYGYKE